MSRLFLTVAALLLVVGLPAAFAGSSADPGITSRTILIGGTTPLTGSAQAFAAVARGAEAYFKYVNSRGGVNRRKINYKYVDDAYNPAETVRKTRELVQEEKVFAIFNSLGTEHNLAIRPYLNEIRVPHLFAATGATTMGRDGSQYPWTIAYQPTYIAEGAMYGNYIKRTKPNARIAILFQDDDYGKDLINGLRRGLGARANRIVAREGHAATDDNVQSQIARLRSSGATVLMLFTTPKFTIQAFQYVNQLGWKPQIYVNAVSSASNIMVISSSRGQNKRVEGAVSIVFLKDPNDPKWARDPGVKLYRQIMRRFGRGNARDVYNVYGMAVAHTFVTALRKAGANPTRRSVMNAVLRLNDRTNPFI
ncbi:MAG: ABC transporter substrate-binding protein, partial [Gaiellaceae bacterium]